MATAILRSHDCLRNQLGSGPIPNPRFVNHASRCRRRKRSPTDVNRRSSAISNNIKDNLSSSPPSKKGLVMGQVKILKRGEVLKPKMFSSDEGVSDLCSTDRLGPDPDVVRREIRVPSDLYAGPTSIASSPHPSSLPFPGFLARRSTAESDLRKLLKI